MDAATPPPGFYFFVAVFWLVVACTILMVLFKLAVWWGERRAMSSEEAEPAARAPVRWSGAGGASDPARAHLHQVEQESEPYSAPPAEPVSLHMSRDAEIAWLTVQRNDDGTYRHSANKIAAFMGGTESVVKAQVAAIRAKKEAETNHANSRLERPAQGWPSKAA